ncbi:MAG: pseudaminic acid synthase [Candidatus Omnitrophica bacterium]|nr:pseudaminic acid synthase [Candidatus Omnitrophota bacterium]
MDYKFNQNSLIGDRWIGIQYQPFVVAEMSGNHNRSLDKALALVDAAARAGAHAVKTQTYTPDTITLDIAQREFIISDPESLWNGRSLYELYSEAYTPWEWHEPIFKRCKKLGLIYFSTPFDATAVDFLETLEVPCYKIASFENIDLPLIRKVAATGKPLIVSTGMATLEELRETVDTVYREGTRDLILLKCTSAYPAKAENANLLTLPHMRELFQCHVGLSDHTLGTEVAVASVALGATVIEKHLKLDLESEGVDSVFSVKPAELRELVTRTENAWRALGSVKYGPTEAEKKSLPFRRSLYVVKDIKKGEQLTNENVRSIRPGYGLPPKFLNDVLGKRVSRDVKRGTPLKWDLTS